MVRSSLVSLSFILLTSPLSTIVYAHPAANADHLQRADHPTLAIPSTTAAPSVSGIIPNDLLNKRATKSKSNAVKSNDSKTAATTNTANKSSPTTTTSTSPTKSQPTTASSSAPACSKKGRRGLFGRNDDCGPAFGTYIPRPTHDLSLCLHEGVDCYLPEVYNGDDIVDDTNDDNTDDSTEEGEDGSTEDSDSGSGSGSNGKGDGTSTENTSEDSGEGEEESGGEDDKNKDGKDKEGKDKDGKDKDGKNKDGEDSSSQSKRRSLTNNGTALAKRGPGRPTTANVKGKTPLKLESLSYPGPKELWETQAWSGLTKVALFPQFTEADIEKDYRKMGDISLVDDYDKGEKNKDVAWATEHIIELQTMKNFVESVMGTDKGKNAVKMTKPKPMNDGSFFIDWWNKVLKKDLKQRPNKPTYHSTEADWTGKDADKATINNLVYQALGSYNNREDFVLCEAAINSIKKTVWVGDQPVEKTAFNKVYKAVKEGKIASNRFLKPIRTVLMVFQYFKQQEVIDRFRNEVKNVKTEFQNIKYLTGEEPELDNYWKVYMDKKVHKIAGHGMEWLTTQLKQGKKDLTDHRKKLKASRNVLKKAEAKQTPAEKKKLEDEIKKLQAQLKKEEDAYKKAEDDLEKQRQTVATTSGAAKKKARAELNRRKKKCMEAELAMGTTRYTINTKTSKGIEGVIKEITDDLAIIKSFNTAKRKVSMPKPR